MSKKMHDYFCGSIYLKRKGIWCVGLRFAWWPAYWERAIPLTSPYALCLVTAVETAILAQCGSLYRVAVSTTGDVY